MERLIAYCLIALTTMITCPAWAQWTQEMYADYSYSNYTNYPDFNRSVETSGFDADLLEAAIFYETNRQRALYGLPLFEYSYNLEVSAHNHSVDMVNYDFFDHESPVSGKKTLEERLAIVEMDQIAMAEGENIAIMPLKSSYAATAGSLVDQWMRSPLHKENILDTDFTHLGCGVAFYRYGSTIHIKATQNFVGLDVKSPSSSSSSSSVSNAWTAEEIRKANTAASASYMSDIEKEVMMYLNLARLYPKKFAAIEVKDYQHAQGYGVYPSFPQYKQGLLDKLNSMTPIHVLTPDAGLDQMAQCWAEESSRYGLRGHQRVNCTKGYSAECCAYGVYTAIDIVLQWLIDDGVPSLGHRLSCLSPAYSKAGISFMKHSTEDHVTVLDMK